MNMAIQKADMHVLNTNNSDTWKEPEEGGISMTKSAIPFTSVCNDHACEQTDEGSCQSY